jgi:hypothetical protein
MLGASGALLTTACVIPIAWLGFAIRIVCFACWRV